MNHAKSKSWIAVGAMGAIAIGFSGSASAHSNVDFNLSIGEPDVVYAPTYTPEPVVIVPPPRPAYYPPPVYYSPGYYRYGDGRDNERHHDWDRHEWREHRRWHKHDDDDD